MKELEIKVKDENNINIISIHGKLDGNTSSLALDQIMPYIVPDCMIIFNMESCSMITSAGLRLLLQLEKKMVRIRGEGVLAGLSDEIKEIMDMTGFNSIFSCYDTVGDAVILLQKNKG